MNSFNPLTNRWAAVTMVAGVLLIVAELVGTDQQGGILSQAAGSSGAGGDEAVQDAPPEVVIGETPEEDLPQVIGEDSPDLVDASEQIDGEGGEEVQDIDDSSVGDEFVEDDSGE